MHARCCTIVGKMVLFGGSGEYWGRALTKMDLLQEWILVAAVLSQVPIPFFQI